MVVKPLRKFARSWAKRMRGYGSPVRVQLTANPGLHRKRGMVPKYFEPINDETMGESLPQKRPKNKRAAKTRSTIFIRAVLKGMAAQEVIAHEIGHAIQYSGKKDSIHPVMHHLSSVFSIISEMEYAKLHNPSLFRSFMNRRVKSVHPLADKFVRELFFVLKSSRDRKKFMAKLREKYINDDFAIMDLYNLLPQSRK